MSSTNAASQIAKPALSVVDMNEKVQARKEAYLAEQNAELTRLDSLAKALKERCFLLEQCLVQERKDTHRLRHEMSQAKKSKVASLTDQDICVELESLRDLVQEQSKLIDQLHAENCKQEEEIKLIKSSNESLYVANERMKQSNIMLRRTLNAEKKKQEK